jgi:hypothetical protein
VEQLIKRVGERLNAIGFERARRATAALGLSVFMSLFLILAFILFMNGQDVWVPAFVGLAICYGVAFMGVAAEWFWGRWFGSGLAWSGVMVAVVPMIMQGEWNPFLGAFGALHLLIILMLAGTKMAARFDLQPAWRERYAMDEFGVARLRKTVTRASASLPSVILWAFGPKEPGQGMAIAGIAALILAVAGLRGVIRVRTWGLAALGAAAALVFATGDVLSPTIGLSANMPSALGLGPTLAATFLAVAVTPFVGPAIRYLRR